MVLLLIPIVADAATRYDPRLRFRTLSTRRFDIHFHQREEGLAHRLAGFVEAAAAKVDAAVGAAVGRVQVILVDQHDLSNGWATPLPYNTIEISAAAPPVQSGIGNSADWLHLVFVHEYTHIAHLSRAGGWIQGLRRGFGRLPLLFPNLYQPIWGIEGVATWQESRQTGEGRVRAGDFGLMLHRAASAGRFEPIDRASGGNVDWPGGNGPYLYGAYFHEYLARTYGDESIRRLTVETGRRIPYLGSRAYKKVFGKSLGQLWTDFEGSTRAAADPSPPNRAVRLTHQGFRVATPRLRADGHLFYSSVTPHDFPALMELVPGGAAPRVVAKRYLGGAIGLAGDHLVLDELDLVRSVAVQSDLYIVDPRTGRRQRVTREARAADPDVAPDGRSVACTIQMADRRALAVFSLPAAGATATPEVLLGGPFDYALPRWSPDGRSIAVERRHRGTAATLVVIDAATRLARVVPALPGGRSGGPVWTPDGTAILFSAAVGDQPFRLHRYQLSTGAMSRLEGTGASAQSPEVAADGSRVIFVGYTPDGYDLFSIDLPQAEWTTVTPAPDGGPIPVEGDVPLDQPQTATPYSPWRTLLPTFWTPTVESDADELVIGAATGSVDALGRHAYGVEAGWSTQARPDWQVAYAYDRWRPTLFVSFADDTDPWRAGTVRTREADAGLLLPFLRVRTSHSLLASVHVADDTFECAGCEEPVDAALKRRSIRSGYVFSSAQGFGYSISPEEGVRGAVTAEVSRASAESNPAETAGGNGIALTADVRHYRRLGPRHGVLAVRAAAAGSWGDDTAEQIFSASGNGPQPGGFGFGVDAIGLLRGFGEDAIQGTRAAVVNIDYRLPLMRVARGVGTVPLFVRNFHGAVFADIGSAWTEAARWRDVSGSVGAEISADAVVGFALPLTVTAGAAVRRDGAAGDRDVVVFGRVGRAF
jgi:Tol biopolymer transport system component